MKRLFLMVLVLSVGWHNVGLAQGSADVLSIAGEIASGSLGAVAGLYLGFVVDASGLSEVTGTALGQSLGLTVGTVAGLQGFGFVSGVRGNLLVSTLGVMAGQYLSGVILAPLLMPRINSGELNPAHYGVYVSIGAVVGAVLLGQDGAHALDFVHLPCFGPAQCDAHNGGYFFQQVAR